MVGCFVYLSKGIRDVRLEHLFCIPEDPKVQEFRASFEQSPIANNTPKYSKHLFYKRRT